LTDHIDARQAAAAVPAELSGTELLQAAQEHAIKRMIELSEGTHTVTMENNRTQFFHELMGFLDEEKPLALK